MNTGPALSSGTVRGNADMSPSGESGRGSGPSCTGESSPVGRVAGRAARADPCRPSGPYVRRAFASRAVMHGPLVCHYTVGRGPWTTGLRNCGYYELVRCSRTC